MFKTKNIQNVRIVNGDASKLETRTRPFFKLFVFLTMLGVALTTLVSVAYATDPKPVENIIPPTEQNTPTKPEQPKPPVVEEPKPTTPPATFVAGETTTPNTQEQVKPETGTTTPTEKPVEKPVEIAKPNGWDNLVNALHINKWIGPFTITLSSLFLVVMLGFALICNYIMKFDHNVSPRKEEKLQNKLSKREYKSIKKVERKQTKQSKKTMKKSFNKNLKNFGK